MFVASSFYIVSLMILAKPLIWSLVIAEIEILIALHIGETKIFFSINLLNLT